MSTIGRAQSLAQLAQLAASSPALSLGVPAALAGMQLSTRTATALRVLLGNLVGVTVRELLVRGDLKRFLEATGAHDEVLAAFEQWIAKVAAESSPKLGGDWVELLRGARIPDLESWNAAMLGMLIPHRLKRESLGELARKGKLSGGEESALSTALRQLLQRAQLGRSAPMPELEPTGDERLDEFRRALRELRRDSWEGFPPGLVKARLRASANGDDLAADVSIEGDLRQLSQWGYSSYGYGRSFLSEKQEAAIFAEADELEQAGVFRDVRAAARSAGQLPKLTEGMLSMPGLARWRESLSVQCWCGRAACIHRAVFLDLLLEDTAKLGLAAAKLARVLLVPAWQRALDELAEPRAPGRDDLPGVLSFVVTERGADPFFHVDAKKGPAKRGVQMREGIQRFIPRLRGLDRKIAENWALSGEDFRYSSHATVFYGDALLLLEGHPAVRLRAGGPCVPTRIERAHLRVAETDSGVELSVVAEGEKLEKRDLARGFQSTPGFVLLRPGNDHVRLLLVPHEVARLLSVTDAHGRSFPREALPGLVGILPRLEAVTQVELPEDLKGEEHPSASKPVLRIEPAGAGLLISLRSEPLASGPLFVPGQGGPFSASFDGTRRRFARRDFERELQEAAPVVADLGLDPAGATEPFSWVLEAGDRSVEILRRVHHLADRGLAVEWIAPKAKFSRPAVLGALRLRVQKKRDWFGLDGEVEIDERRVGLAALLEAARARRRWVQLAPGDYVELSEELLARLTPIAHIAGPKDLPTLTLGTVPLVEALAAEVESFDAAEGWRKLTDRLAQAREKDFPLPEGLRAELRDYQVEGFRWLSRLADWGAGACLADDMGLGKTMQALALLLSRRALGPALVIAPSSVLHSWRVEANQFAPALRLHLFHEGDRAIDAWGPNDVIVVSWTMFARNAALFAARKFATAVLDEVQAIKNANTLRAKAAHGLSAEFIVALTGTPIENHVGELWSLFRAVLPSLLGSEEGFRRAFASGAPETTQALAALVQPFILRRKKSEVARELPARTEVDVLVPLSPEERSLYDDVRLSAAGDLGSLTGEKQRFQVLAALTKLRLTACHPKLQDPRWTGPASKLARLLELLRDLSLGGHRALVFSQFTMHLAIVSEALRAEGIPFSYLDGSTPIAERQRRVEQFQAGQGGDLFLISLKAGGTGLTLTAADYVIHLDPWWNPAVEDQASDRAHRIGQTRPVTVYRLIAEGTIEQQILSMHREKRELVDAVLAGTDRAAKLSAEELASLIRG
jgi:superfamily II DNA or RNA helicase